MSSYTSWYKDGTASAVNGATAVTGVDTYWGTAGIHPGDMMTFDDGRSFVEIASVNSDTSITLAKPFTGGTIANGSYAIVRNFTAGTLPEVASQVVDALGKYTRYFNEDIATLNGKSAYEVAKDNGYTGTASQWLESLKAAGEWSTLNDRTNILTYHNAAAHNSYYRGKNLGTAITASQIQAIRNGTFADLYVGDAWTLPIDGTTYATIMGFNICFGGWGTQHAVVMLSNQNWKFSINDTDTCEGHLYNSKMYTVHLPYILGKIKEVIPEYRLTHSGYGNGISDAINSSGLVSHRINSTTEQIFLPSLANITGSEILDNRCAYQSFSRNKLWPYFLFNKSGLSLGHLWLDSNFDTTHWCFNDSNNLNYYFIPASTVWPVCPYILLG